MVKMNAAGPTVVIPVAIAESAASAGTAMRGTLVAKSRINTVMQLD